MSHNLFSLKFGFEILKNKHIYISFFPFLFMLLDAKATQNQSRYTLMDLIFV